MGKVKGIRGAALFLALICLFSGCKKNGASESEAPERDGEDFVPATAVLRIEDEFLYEYEYRYFYALRYGSLAEEGLIDGDTLNDAKEYKAKAVLAKKAELCVTEAEREAIDKKAELYLQHLYENNAELEFQAEDTEAFLELFYGVTKEEFLKIYYNLYAGGEYMLLLTEEIAAASDSEIEAYYNENVNKYRSVEIMFAYFEASGDVTAKAAKTEKELAEIDSAEEMSEFIAENSELYGANEKGGAYTYYYGDGLFPEFREFCSKESLAGGDKTVIVGDKGIYAVYCNYINDLSSESVRTEISEAISEEKTAALLKEKIAELEITENN